MNHSMPSVRPVGATEALHRQVFLPHVRHGLGIVPKHAALKAPRTPAETLSKFYRNGCVGLDACVHSEGHTCMSGHIAANVRRALHPHAHDMGASLPRGRKFHGVCCSKACLDLWKSMAVLACMFPPVARPPTSSNATETAACRCRTCRALQLTTMSRHVQSLRCFALASSYPDSRGTMQARRL